MAVMATQKYNVGGIALDRPFKIRRLGHFGFNATHFEASKPFYFDLLGFSLPNRRGRGFWQTRRRPWDRQNCKTFRIELPDGFDI
jgi:catechol 2,3-dioxygenase-like lactoylglutathione lyase family enzyme